MTATIKEIYRYPVKGLAGEGLQDVALQVDASIPNDRRFAIARGTLAKGGSGGDVWQPKSVFHTLVRDERLAQLGVRFDPDSGLLTLHRHGRRVARGKATDPVGRTLINQFLAAFVGEHGQGTPSLLEAKGFAYSDVPDPYISLINLASVEDLTRVVGTGVHPLRFRANIYFSGANPWQEQEWTGCEIQVGSARIKVVDDIERCAATNVDPESAKRNMNVPLSLQRGFGHCLMGVYARVVSDGTIATGDRLLIRA